MFDAFNRGDIPFMLSNCHKDCIWEAMGQPDIPYSGIYHGPEDIGNFFEKLNETVETTELATEHYFEAGNLVVTTGRWSGITRQAKKPVSSIITFFNEFNEEGKLVHFRDCYDTLTVAKALKS